MATQVVERDVKVDFGEQFLTPRGRLSPSEYITHVLHDINLRNGEFQPSNGSVDLRGVALGRDLLKRAARRVRRIGQALKPDTRGIYQEHLYAQYIHGAERAGLADPPEIRVREIEREYAQCFAWIEGGRNSMADMVDRETSSVDDPFVPIKRTGESRAEYVLKGIQKLLEDNAQSHSPRHGEFSEIQLARLVYMHRKIERALSDEKPVQRPTAEIIDRLTTGDFNREDLLKALTGALGPDGKRGVHCYNKKYGKLDVLLALVFDQWYKMETESPAGCFNYISTPAEFIVKLVHELKITKDDLICDVGCGAGKALLLFGLLTEAKVMGIEVNKELAEIAAEALDRFNIAKREEGVILNANAFDPELDLSKPTIFFLFTPFQDSALQHQFAERLAAEAEVRDFTVCSLYQFSDVLEEHTERFERLNFEDYMTGITIFRTKRA